MPGRMAGKVVLVTGAARGQGAAEVRLFAAEGARVLAADVLDAETEAVAASAGARSLHLDVSSAPDWAAAVASLRSNEGRLDVLVNNAGIPGPRDLARTSEEEWDRVVAVNQKGAWLGMRACAPVIESSGGGAIVNVGSIYALVGTRAAAAYHASKGALRAMTRQAALELAPKGIRVNAVHPGLIGTPMLAPMPEEELRSIRRSKTKSTALLSPQPL
ncbi:MAG: SDR family NAD(P)-dependent oxidoreductase, partial [Candidatus Dormibacterales bacterium]